jgi:Tol biopolymer transport system component
LKTRKSSSLKVISVLTPVFSFFTVMSLFCSCSKSGLKTEPTLIGENWYYSASGVSNTDIVGFEYDSNTIFVYNITSGIKKPVLKLPASRGLVDTPGLYGDKVVYITGDKDFPSAGWSGSGKPNIDSNFVVSILDLKTGEVKDLTTDKHMKMLPGIFGDTVVWVDSRNSDVNYLPQNWDVYIYDLKENKETRLTLAPTATRDSLAINADWIVWCDNRNGTSLNPFCYDVYAYDLKHGVEKRLSSVSSSEDWNISLNANSVVWTDSRNVYATNSSYGYRDIYLYDLTNNEERRITSSSGKDSFPVIDGNGIVWIQETAELTDNMFVYDIKTGQETQISHTDNAALHPPAISGNKIFWMESMIKEMPNDTGFEAGYPFITGIYLYNLDTKRQIALDLPAKARSAEARQVPFYPAIFSDNYVLYDVGNHAGTEWTYLVKIN